MSNAALIDIEAKLAGAQDRLYELERRVTKGAMSDLLKFRTDRDRKRRVRIRVDEVAEIPQKWHVWIGECIHDMRSALDHLAFALNTTGSGLDRPPNWKKSQFPIYSNRERFRKMLQTSRKKPNESPIGYFPHGARAELERLQPYHRWHDINTRLLAVLGELSDIDKHRSFPLTVVGTRMLMLPTTIEGHAVTNTKTAPIGTLKPGATIAWLEVPSLPPSTKQPQVPFPHAGAVNFERKTTDPKLPLILEFEPVEFVLRSVLRRVRETVLPAFEPFLC